VLFMDIDMVYICASNYHARVLAEKRRKYGELQWVAGWVPADLPIFGQHRGFLTIFETRVGKGDVMII